MLFTYFGWFVPQIGDSCDCSASNLACRGPCNQCANNASLSYGCCGDCIYDMDDFTGEVYCTPYISEELGCGAVTEPCGENEEYSYCGSACPEQCGIYEYGCIELCVPGCFCKEGFILDEAGEACIKRGACKNTTAATEIPGIFHSALFVWFQISLQPL